MNAKKAFRTLTVVFLLVLISAVLFAAHGVCALSREKAGAESYYDEENGSFMIDTNYWFEEISFEAEVRKDKTVAVTETMLVGFLKGGVNTGIIRDIQRISRTTRIIDGVQEAGERYLAGISDVSVTINGEPALVTESLYDNGNFYSVKMQQPGAPYFPATDQSDRDSFNRFVLSYVYDMSDDKAAGYDDFTLDVLGYAMAFTERFSAQITFPWELDPSSVTVRTNRKEPWTPEDGRENFSVEGNVISLSAAPERENKGYTVQVILPDGFFTVSRSFYWYYVIFAAISAAAVAFGLILFWRYRPQKVVEPVEFYPPEGMGVMRYSAVWHGKSRSKDIAALILKWASQGCIEVIPDQKKDVILRRIKSPTDCTAAEAEYFDTLFSPYGAKTVVNETFSSREMRQGSFETRTKGRNLASAVDKIQTESDIPSPYLQGRTGAVRLLVVSALIPLLCVMIYTCILTASFLPFLLFLFPAAGISVGFAQVQEKISPIVYIFPVAFTALPMGIFFGLFYVAIYDYACLAYLALVWLVVAFFLQLFFKRRAPETLNEYGRMRGFRRFLLTAELSRIEAVLLKDPEYYYDILPYCMIMDISKKVEKRFEPLHLAAPAWTGGVSAAVIASAVSHSVSSAGGGSSGGGGGGGGSSGGGGGGGGSRGC